MRWNKIILPKISDARGDLTFIEDKSIFPIKRIFYLYGIKNERGGHAHKKCKQVIMAISGGFKLSLDDGNMIENIELSSQNEIIIVDNLVWVNITDFKENSVCLVLASEYYDELDYIRDYKNFIEEICK